VGVDARAERRVAAALSLALVALLSVAVCPAGASRGAPARFFGVVPQAPLTKGDFERLGGLGLNLRLAVTWSEVEPRRGEYDFAGLDRVFAEAAANGTRVMPQLGGAPAWSTASPAPPPLGGSALAEWRGFLRALVERYGSGGQFWRGRGQRLPVRQWQVWNEPNFILYWPPRPSPRGYVRLLHASAATIRAADPQAQIVAAAVAPIEHTYRPWVFLRRMYQVPGFKRDFDVAAVHPYSATTAGVEYVIRRIRKVMAQAGDGGKPLLLSEVGVASDAERPTAFDQGPQGQAQFLERTFSRLLAERRRWRIAGAYWFTWEDAAGFESSCSFCQYAGLFDRGGDPKPAWWALRRVVSGAARRAVR
jgi:hypothetical protein